MPVFRIIHETNYVEADNRRTALTFARSKLAAEPLSSREIVSLDRAGKAIIDASTGESLGAESQQEG
jgi:hypothetical protein